MSTPRDSMSDQEKDREHLIREIYEISDMHDDDMHEKRMAMWEMQREHYLMRWDISLTGDSVPDPIPYTMCYGTPLPDLFPFECMK